MFKLDPTRVGNGQVALISIFSTVFLYLVNFDLQRYTVIFHWIFKILLGTSFTRNRGLSTGSPTVRK